MRVRPEPPGPSPTAPAAGRARAPPSRELDRRTTADVGGRIARVAVIPVILLLLLGAAPASPVPKTSTGAVLAITQSTRITAEQTFTVSAQVADPANVTFAYFLFCQLTSSVCYSPVTMTLHGTNWFVGTTKPMTSYPGMRPGVVAGYNISLDYRDNVNLTYPTLPNHFTNLTIATTVVGEYMYEMSVAPLVFGLSGAVRDSVSGTPITGATISISNASGPTNTTTTGATGAYAFEGLANGTYQLSVSEHGYQTSSQTVAIAGQSAVANVPLTNANGTPPRPASGTPWWSSVSSAGHNPVALAAIAGVVLVLVAGLVVWRRRVAAGTRASDPSDASPPKPG